MRGLFLEVFRYIGDLKVFRLSGIIPNLSLLAENIDNTDKTVLKSNWNRHDQRVCSKDVLDLINYPIKIRAKPVQLIDKYQPSHAGVVCVTPIGF